MRPINIVLRADGRVEHLPKAPTIAEVAKLLAIPPDDCVGGFSLRDGRYAYMADRAHARGLPRNEAATKLYLATCIPGTQHWIPGDVVIVREEAPW